MTTVRWEAQVEKAFCLPSAEGIFEDSGKNEHISEDDDQKVPIKPDTDITVTMNSVRSLSKQTASQAPHMTKEVFHKVGVAERAPEYQRSLYHRENETK